MKKIIYRSFLVSYVKLHKELKYDAGADNDESKKKDSQRKEIKDTRRKRKTERTANESQNNKERSQSLLRRENFSKSMQWPAEQKRNIRNSTNTGKKDKLGLSCAKLSSCWVS